MSLLLGYFWIDLLLLQDIIRAPINNEAEILVRQARRSNMRELLKEIEEKGVAKIIAHLDSQDTYYLMKAVCTGQDTYHLMKAVSIAHIAPMTKYCDSYWLHMT